MVVGSAWVVELLESRTSTEDWSSRCGSGKCTETPPIRPWMRFPWKSYKAFKIMQTTFMKSKCALIITISSQKLGLKDFYNFNIFVDYTFKLNLSICAKIDLI